MNASLFCASNQALVPEHQVWTAPEFIHAFNKFGRHLEFSINDVIHGKIMHAAKMATKDESSVDVDFVVLCSVFR